MTTETTQVYSLEDIVIPLAKMKAFIEAKEIQDWEEFNEAKKTFLERFKTLAQSLEKQQSWKEFTEYADSARALRKLQEEEGEFAAEMILKALDALDHEVDHWQAVKSHIYLPIFDKVAAFKPLKEAIIEPLLKFKFLAVKGQQLQDLRQELTKTGMRLSVKGKLFDRLSKLGDKIFPVKKEAAALVLEYFQQGLQGFCNKAEGEEDGLELLFQIRIIQGFLKELVLKKGDYESIKKRLDPLWKKGTLLKDKKELEMSEARLRSATLKTVIEEELKQIEQRVSEQQDQEALKAYEGLVVKMKDRQLLKSDYRTLKDQLENLCKPVFERKKAKELEKDLFMKQQDQLIQDKKEQIFSKMQQTTDSAEKKVLLDTLLSLPLNVLEAYQYQHDYYRDTAAAITDLFALEKLYFELKQMQGSLRSDLFSSSLDFSLSMGLNELYDQIRELASSILKRLG